MYVVTVGDLKRGVWFRSDELSARLPAAFLSFVYLVSHIYLKSCPALSDGSAGPSQAEAVFSGVSCFVGWFSVFVFFSLVRFRHQNFWVRFRKR